MTCILQYPSNIGFIKPLSGSNFGIGINKYLYCWSWKHYFKHNYPAFQEDFNNSCIYLNKNKKVYLGTYLPNIKLIYMRQEKSRKDCIVDAKKLRYFFLLLVNMQTLKIGELEPNPYSTDEKIEYISLDKLIRIGVLIACSNKLKPTIEPSKGPIKQILRQHIQKEKEYATPKNV